MNPIALTCRRGLAAGVMCGALSGPLSASVVKYLNPDQDQWYVDAGPTDTIDFVLGSGQVLDDQYAHLGVLFTGANGGSDYAVAAGAYSLDGWGAYTGVFNPPVIELVFDVPRHAFAAHYPGARGIMLFSEGELIYETSYLSSAPISFLGLISTAAFDEVWLIGGGAVAIDNIYFSQAPIPTPGVIALLAIGAITGSRRRGRGS